MSDLCGLGEGSCSFTFFSFSEGEKTDSENVKLSLRVLTAELPPRLISGVRFVSVSGTRTITASKRCPGQWTAGLDYATWLWSTM